MKTTTLARVALFIIYFWFGILKIFGWSPATPLIENLLEVTLPFLTIETFMVLFGLFEMAIGILFLIPKATKIAKIIFAFHIIATMLPLILLPSMAWQAAFVPTLEGQYMIKNIVLIVLVLGL